VGNSRKPPRTKRSAWGIPESLPEEKEARGEFPKASQKKKKPVGNSRKPPRRKRSAWGIPETLPRRKETRGEFPLL